MTLHELIAEYGYWALVIGTFFEGETIVVLAGLAAHRGYLDISWVAFLSFAGTFTGDQIYFYLGRRYGEKIFARWPSWLARVERVRRMLQKYDTGFILGFRFAYGLRTVSPFVLGMSGVAPRRFLVLNLCAAAVWAAIMAGGGYIFGHVLELILEEFKRYELYAFAAIVCVGLLIWASHFIRRKRRDGTQPESTGHP